MKNNCQKNKNKNSGFTLIELIIVIGIIAILSAFVIQSSSGASKSARDAQRKSDISQYRIALENYSIKKGGLYPSRTSIQIATTVLGPDLGPTYMASYPADPISDSSYYYRYQSDGQGNATPTATQYILWAKLERCSSGTVCYWYVCANGNSLEKLTTAPASTDCF